MAARSSTRTCGSRWPCGTSGRRVAALPVAFEPPSAGFVLDWSLLSALKQRGVGFATLTHAAGLSSTGDEALDARLPLDEPYHVPAATVSAIAKAQVRGGRVIALGTTVTRALEHAASRGELHAGPGWPTSASAPTRSCAWSMSSSAARTSRGPATTSCCEPLRRMTSCAMRARNSSGTAFAPTSSATRSGSSARPRADARRGKPQPRKPRSPSDRAAWRHEN